MEHRRRRCGRLAARSSGLPAPTNRIRRSHRRRTPNRRTVVRRRRRRRRPVVAGLVGRPSDKSKTTPTIASAEAEGFPRQQLCRLPPTTILSSVLGGRF